MPYRKTNKEVIAHPKVWVLTEIKAHNWTDGFPNVIGVYDTEEKVKQAEAVFQDMNPWADVYIHQVFLNCTEL